MLLLSQFCAHGATRPTPPDPPPPRLTLQAATGIYGLTGNAAELILNGPPVYACAMLAGDYHGFGAGYTRTGFTVGTIDAEPVPGHTLLNLLRVFSNTSLAFSGDATALLAGRFVWVNGVSYAAGFGGWAYSSESGQTVALWFSGGPTFAAGVSYIIEFKA